MNELLNIRHNFSTFRNFGPTFMTFGNGFSLIKIRFSSVKK